jgi:hypothetical protein
MEQKLRSLDLPADTKIELRRGRGQSMSDALSDVIGVYTHLAKDKAAFEKMVVVGAIAWNACASKPEDGQKLLEGLYDEIRKTGDRQHLTDTQGIIEEFMERKRLLHPNNNRLIISWTVDETRNGFHLQVASTSEGIS